jgi:Cu(I)/Ag(I) efflux system membrane fusion protein
VAAREVAVRLHAIDCGAEPLPAATAEAWQAMGPQLAQVADAVAAAASIASRRLAFEPLSDGLWTVLERFGVGEVAAVRRFHCPMALDGAGAYWLQQGPVTANPYYGASMLRCGSQAAVLGDPGGGEGR